MTGAVAIAFASACVIATSAIVVALASPKGVTARWVLFWLAAFGQIVLLSEILSELRLLGRGGFLAGHAVLLAAGVLAWRRAGSPRPGLDPRPLAISRPLVLFAALVAALTVANVIWPFLYPPLTGDANAYHLPRAYYWSQLGTARHFPSVDFRMNELPPNVSFAFAWILAISGGFAGLHLPQAAAGLALAAATVGLALFAGAGRDVALFAGLLTLTWPMTILQMGSSQTDLVAAAAGIASVLFGLRAAAAERERRPGELVSFGLAFGLAAGAKTTCLFLVPGLAAAMMVVALSRGTPRALVRAGAAASCGFALFGAYGYVLNFVDSGRPFGSKRGWELLYAGSAPWQLDSRANTLRYLEQALDWPGLARGDASVLERTEEAFFAATGRFLGIDSGVRHMRPGLRHSRWMPDDELSGFGPHGFLVILLAPAAFVFSVVGWWRTRDPARLVPASLGVVALSWYASFLLAAQPWSGQLRFFLLVMPLVAAATFPWLTAGKAGRAAAALIGLCALAVAASVTARGPNGIREGSFRRSDLAASLCEEVMSDWTRRLLVMYPAGATIGMSPEYNDTVFHLFRSLPRFRFIPIAEEDVAREIASGRVDAALTGQFRDEGGQGITRPERPLPRSFLHPRSPRAFFLRHPEEYRLRFVAEDGALRAELPLPQRLTWEGPRLLLRIPAALLRAIEGRSVLGLLADRPLTEADGVGVAGGTLVRDVGLLRIALEAPDPSRSFVDVELSRRAATAPIHFTSARLDPVLGPRPLESRSGETE